MPNLSTLKQQTMKKLILLAAVAAFTMSAQAQTLETPSFWQNWSVGLDAGVSSPLKGHSFLTNMRPTVGLTVKKQITPVFGLGVEGQFGINTSSWLVQKGVAAVKSSTAFDNLYVGPFATVNLMNLFGGYNCEIRKFDIEAVLGCGWGHYIYDDPAGQLDSGWSFFATKAGLNFNFNVSDFVTIGIQPSVTYDMSDASGRRTSCNYNINRAAFNLLASVSYRFGGNGFQCVAPAVDNSGEIDALNAKINDLRGQLSGAENNAKALKDQNAALAAQLAAAQNQKPKTEVIDNSKLSSVRYVFYKIGSSVITPDQMPNVEMIASYLKNHKGSKVNVKGYASQDGNQELNIKLAAARAESVKNALVKKYGIAADRINAEGEGIGHMFTEESWNRVSICVIDEK